MSTTTIEPKLLSWNQLRWLMAHGGRDETHVLDNEKGPYVLMGKAGGGVTEIYIPDEWHINEYFRTTG